MLSRDYLVGGRNNGLTNIFFNYAKLYIGQSGSFLDPRKCNDVRIFKTGSTDGEVLYRSLGLSSIQGILWYFDLAHGVVFNAVFHLSSS